MEYTKAMKTSDNKLILKKLKRQGGLVWASSQYDCLVKPVPLFFCSTALLFVPFVRYRIEPHIKAMKSTINTCIFGEPLLM